MSPDSKALSDVGETTQDDFLGGLLTIAQPKKGHRSGIDAVLLAAACPAKAGDMIADFGAGAGVAGLCVLKRVENCRAALIEIEPVMAALACQNVTANGFGDHARVIAQDIMAKGATAMMGFEKPSVDHVIINPPFETHGRARISPDERKALAHAGGAEMLDIWVRVAASITKAKGTLTIIHRADALEDVLRAMRTRFGGIRVLPVLPRPKEAATRIIVQGIKGARAPLSILPPLILHGENGHGFQPRVEAILRGGAALQLA